MNNIFKLRAENPYNVRRQQTHAGMDEMYKMDQFGERVDCVLLIVFVLLLSKHSYVAMKNRLHGSTGCMGCLLCQNILVLSRKNGCLSCFICTS